MTAPKSPDTIEIPEVGTVIKVSGTSDGVWRFKYVNKDGSWCLYGGDKNPNGVQGFRSFRVDRCSLPVVKVKRAKRGVAE